MIFNYLSMFKLVAFVVCLGALTSPTVAQSPLRIMALGDSITAGYTDNPTWNTPYNHGYRSGLYNRLTASGLTAGVDFTFVGKSPEAATDGTALLFLPNLNTGDWSFGGTRTPTTDLESIGQNNHRGYGGAQSQGVNNFVVGWINQDDPDVILLKLGTNDRNANALDSLIGNIIDAKSDVSIVLSQIIPKFNNNLALRQEVADFNQAIRDDIFPKYESQGLDIVLVDNFTDFLTNPNDPNSINFGLSATGNHPNGQGYEVIAENFFNGYQSLRVTGVPEPSGSCVLGMALLTLLSRRRSVI